MGEIADAMLDGTLCEGCGTFMGDGYGFPGYCSDQCAEDRGMDPETLRKLDRYEPRVPPYRPPPRGKSKKRVAKPGEPTKLNGNIPCFYCKRRLPMKAYGQHVFDAHGAALAQATETECS